MDADLEYWIKKLEADRETLRELHYYDLPHSAHSITELHAIREAIESQTIHAELLIKTLRDIDSSSKKTLLKRIFKK